MTNLKEKYWCAYDGKRIWVPNLRRPSTQQYCSERCEDLHRKFIHKRGGRPHKD
jgi:hypothetical protein